MKKIMLIMVILSVVFIGILPAQGLGFGVKGGLNMAKFSGDDADFEGMADPGFVIGPTIGGFITYNLSDKLAIQPEFLYTAKGSSYNIDEEGFEWDFKFKMNWLDIPVLAVYQLLDNVNVFAGPLLEFYLNGEIDSEISFMGESESETEDIESDDVNSLGFGLIFGGTYMVTDNLGIEARYALGLTSMDSEDNLKNNGLQVLVNYYLKK